MAQGQRRTLSAGGHVSQSFPSFPTAPFPAQAGQVAPRPNRLVSIFPQGLPQGSYYRVRSIPDAAMTPSQPLISISNCSALGWVNQGVIRHPAEQGPEGGEHRQNTASGVPAPRSALLFTLGELQGPLSLTGHTDTACSAELGRSERSITIK